jgi:hypothetical protein
MCTNRLPCVSFDNGTSVFMLTEGDWYIVDSSKDFIIRTLDHNLALFYFYLNALYLAEDNLNEADVLTVNGKDY